MSGRGRKIELCAACSFEGARGSRVFERKPARSIWDMASLSGLVYTTGFFTESLILAQNERWRRV